MAEKNVSIQTLRRLPSYLHYLRSIKDNQTTISATGLAAVFGLGDVQVRKDLGSVSGSGRPKTGYVVEELISQLEDYLGCNANTPTILIGAGHLGQALLSYEGFSDYGLSIVAAFDTNPWLIGAEVNSKPILSVDSLERFCQENSIHLAILTLPAQHAQSMCDKLVAYGIRAIWNFAPTILKVREGIIVENENLASSLAVLSRHLREE